jgi:hypothetical protein
MRALGISFFVLFLALHTAEAKSRIVLVGGTPENCKQQFGPIRATLSSLPIPDDWTFVVVCTSTVWDNLLRRTDGLGKTHTAFTNLEAHYTYFNGSNFAARVAAHELGHILGKTEDHERAEAAGFLLLQQRGAVSPNKR